MQSFEINQKGAIRVYKFGGASVKNAEGVKNVAQIISQHSDSRLLVVVSAMDKTTNALERVVALSQSGKRFEDELEKIINFHRAIAEQLLPTAHDLHKLISGYKSQISQQLQSSGEYDLIYDQVVSVGELLSSQILGAYLTELGISNQWIDARNYILTDNTYREAVVDWDATCNQIQTLANPTDQRIIVTQGFIGRSKEGKTTTLGREGSDYSAAIFGSCLNASSVTIWKDVPGVMTADPKRLPNAVTFDELPFREAAEMTYYGASVIHPKTIKPLANRGTPLLVKNFDNIELPGTRIHECQVEKLPPLFVFKENQCLISCHVTDYTFVDESQIGIIFSALASRGLKVNLMQNSAISFSFCLDFKSQKVMELISELSKSFEVYYNTGLTLITIKNYDAKSFEEYRNKKDVILEQSSRSTLQVLIKS